MSPEANPDAATVLLELFPGAAVETPESVGPPLARAVDQPFGSFYFQDKLLVYDELPGTIRAERTRWLYYGKPMNTVEQALASAARLFTFGRETRGKAHRDVWKHLKGINRVNYGISGFMQTGRIREVIERRYVLPQHAGPALGLLYVIDAAGAQVIDVDALSEHLQSNEPENGEGEVIFSSCLPPFRLLGAGLYTKADREPATLVKVLRNPNYYVPWEFNPSLSQR